MIARDIMSSPVWFTGPDETIAHARRMMVKHRISRVLVMKDGEAQGDPHEKGHCTQVPGPGAGMAAQADRQDPGRRICIEGSCSRSSRYRD